MAGSSYARMWASTADTDRTVEVLKRSFAEGRLTRNELDLRLGQALISRFFGELMEITADLPVGTFGRLPAHPVTPRSGRHTSWQVAAGTAAVAIGVLLMLISVATMIAG